MTCSPLGEGNIMATPVVAFHTPYFGPSATLIAAMRVPSEDQARLEIGIAASSCEACSTRSSWRLKGFQIWSPPPESPTARCVPSGDQATAIGHTFRFSGPAFRCSWRIRSLSWSGVARRAQRHRVAHLSWLELARNTKVDQVEMSSRAAHNISRFEIAKDDRRLALVQIAQG